MEKEENEKTGLIRYFAVLWEHLGKLLAVNILCFAAFLPLALGVTLGLTFENFWITLLGGALGGALACPIWAASLRVCLYCYLGTPMEWFPLWRRTVREIGVPAAWEGAALGALSGMLLSVWQFLSTLTEQGALPAPVVWIGLGLDCFLLAMLVVLLTIPLAFQKERFTLRLSRGIKRLAEHMGTELLCAAGLLLWCCLGIALFPVSVPFAAVLGFWPMLLFLAQLQLPLGDTAVMERFAMEAEPASVPPKRRSPALPLILLAVLTLALTGIGIAGTRQEPDLQVAVVHRDTLPDDVSAALERSLGKLVGDRNADGAVKVQINDYPVVFDGSAQDMNVQTAGMTRLVTDLSARDSSVFLLETPEAFLENYGDLMDLSSRQQWSANPILSALDAGEFMVISDMDELHTGQELLAGYTLVLASSCPEDVAESFLPRQGMKY